ncbi:MAG TPA: RagB/SusD family nutrient uptake outer membrane protein [Cytophagales bacterium]|nr:RagB/SusD family nutrient uptake outer membrane protein [Cytophagales bacterium]HAA20423.1 RagB/SusD family nutrient uptake outer membrane protein [Cytophagales bacterium]HAP58362.1 RagB/SusD family nutrient uptake outer membrane protein [Cytophagales bacterium]
MKLNIKNLAIAGLVGLTFTACTFDEVPNPNAPSVEDATSDPGLPELNNLVRGTESAMRNGMTIYTTALGTISRELYLFDADPRNTDDLLGKNGKTLDNNSFYSTAAWNSRYRCIKNCNLVMEAVNATTAVTDAEADGYRGFANTVMALQYLLVLNSQDENGLRQDVADPLNLGPIVTSKADNLTFIQGLLSTAATQLGNAGSDFAFDLSSGFDGFDTPATFLEFNRALAARVSIYQEDWSGAITALNASFFDIAGDMAEGPEHFFSTGQNDLLNGVFKAPDQNGDQIIVHDDFINDAEAGDLRVAAKTAARANPSTQDGLTGTHETRLYSSPSDGIDIIRNEELVLIYAEANAQLGNTTEATDGINAIRSNAGLADYAGATDANSLIDEILNQRRYSLWCEAHRAVDLRRYDRLNDANVAVDRAGDVVYERFPIPLNDVDAD